MGQKFKAITAIRHVIY